MDVAGVFLVEVRKQRSVDVVAVVDRGQSRQIGLHPWRQRLIRRIHAGEHRIAPRLGHGMQMQDRAQRRISVAGQVRMPALACDELRVGVCMDCDDLRMTGDARDAGMNGQFSERTAEAFVTVVVERLIAEEQHQMISQRGLEFLSLAIGQRAGQVDAGHLRADAGGHRFDGQDIVAHRYSLVAPNGLSL